MAVKTIKIDKQNIKVGYQDIELQVTTPDFKKDVLTDCYGQYIQRENVIQVQADLTKLDEVNTCLLYTSPSPRDLSTSRMPSSA